MPTNDISIMPEIGYDSGLAGADIFLSAELPTIGSPGTYPSNFPQTVGSDCAGYQSGSGCTDPTAFNFNPVATIDDGSCVPLIYGCIDDGTDPSYPLRPAGYTGHGSSTGTGIPPNYNPNANTIALDSRECCYSCDGTYLQGTPPKSWCSKWC